MSRWTISCGRCGAFTASRAGRVLDTSALLEVARRHGAATLIDATQAAGWLPLAASDFDYVVATAYKWLLAPRGAAFMAVRPERLSALRPHSAGWYAGEDVSESYFGPPLRLAKTARRLDIGPAWLCWVGCAASLAFLERVIPAAAASVDRLEQIPARLKFLFDYSATRALENAAVRAEAFASRSVIDALAQELSASTRLLDKEAFRAAATRVRERTGQKGKALFHPIRLALTAAETGHLVFGTLHTSSAAKTIDRIVDVFPAAEKEMVRTMLSESLRAAISQSLLKRIGGGRVAAHEIMIGTPAIRNLIREGKIAQMYSAIQTGQSSGMQTLDQCLSELLSKGLISKEEARFRAQNKDSF